MKTMPDIEKVKKGLECCIEWDFCNKCPYETPNEYDIAECTLSLHIDALELLKEQEAAIPEELKQKMWNALYAVEDEYEKQFVGTNEHDAWFNIFRLWLQKGFNIAIKTIADWEGR